MGERLLLFDPDNGLAIDTRHRCKHYTIWINVNEMLEFQLASIHNLAFYLWLVQEALVIAERFHDLKSEMVRQLSKPVKANYHMKFKS